MNPIDSFLDRTTMYRLVLSSLAALAALSILAAFLGYLPYTAIDLSLSLVILLFASFAANAVGALFTRASPTPESSYITALILFFILTPLQSTTDAVFLMIAAAIAMLSKYILAIGERHLFNPAAFAALLLTVFGSGLVSWWVATPILLPLVSIIGFLVVRKMRRFDVFFSFALTALVLFLIHAQLAHIPLGIAALKFLISLPVIFFGTIMLLDPQTMPTGKGHRRAYAALVGFLFSLSFSFPFNLGSMSGSFASTPELALIIGNLYAFGVGMRRRVELKLHKIEQLSRDAYEYLFIPDRPFLFMSGQYMEWTVPHSRPDNRGTRRYFAISSAPSDPFVRFAMRLPVESSTLKDALRDMKKGAVITATGRAGEFMLPDDPNQPIAAIAGGIGIASFMSMFRHLALKRQRRDIVLIYAASTPLDFAYKAEIDSIKDSIGLRVVYLPTDFTELSGWDGPSGYLSTELLKEAVPDLAVRHWYLAGPTQMVDSYTFLIRSLGIPRSLIEAEYFPGF